MKLTLVIPAVSMFALMCSVGCSTRQTMSGSSVAASHSSSVHANESVALSTLGAAESPRMAGTRGYQLGAGDQLGQAIFANYAAVVRAEAGWQYASGSTME